MAPRLLEPPGKCARQDRSSQYFQLSNSAEQLEILSPVLAKSEAGIDDQKVPGNVRRNGPVTVVYGDNLMKFAPVLGSDLALSLAGEE